MQDCFQKIQCFLAPREALMLEQLHMFCEINSGSHHLRGINRIREALHHAFTPLADSIERIQSAEGTPPLLFIRKRPELTRRVLLSGHMDTVFGESHAFQNITALEPGILNGPGVSDMKGGLIVMLHALEAFEQTPIAKTIGWDVVINADEELGSPASAAFFKKIRDNYQAALVYEPALTPDGLFARSRRGSGKFTLTAHGKAAHVGRAFHAGRNAIAYLAEAIQKIHALNQNNRDITFNIGQVSGGEALNMVPDTAFTRIDVRIAQPEDSAWVFEQFQAITKQLKRPDYALTLDGHFGRPVKQINPATEALFKRLQAVGKLQNLSLDWQDTGGCCDGNNLAEAGLAVIDTLGVRGGNIHSAEEFLLIESLLERATLTACLLIDLAEGSLETLRTR
jgi:glutamate carboxypeptidase